jgi:hypothetical protein
MGTSCNKLTLQNAMHQEVEKKPSEVNPELGDEDQTFYFHFLCIDFNLSSLSSAVLF